MVLYQFLKETGNREELMEKGTRAITGEREAYKQETSSFKRLRAKICEHCPLCIHARKSPDSTIGKILHHRFHADHCPLWTAYRDVYGESGEKKVDA
jgi:hypothetical protein